MRVRQHVNPLKKELQVPTPPPAWGDLFADPALPLLVDIGSGPGRFPLMLGRRELGRRNVLGVDIRGKLVERANKWAQELGAPNVYGGAPAACSGGREVAHHPRVWDPFKLRCPRDVVSVLPLLQIAFQLALTLAALRGRPPACSPRSAFALANATVSIDTMLATYPGRIDCVAIQFPDPHFKVMHPPYCRRRLLRYGASRPDDRAQEFDGAAATASM